MITIKKAEIIMGWLLTFGTLLSALLVMIGGVLYVAQYGHVNLQTQLDHANTFTSISIIIQAVIAGSPLGLIALGVLLLVATQILRVGLLVGFYALLRDYKFTIISLIVFVILIYTFFHAATG